MLDMRIKNTPEKPTADAGLPWSILPSSQRNALLFGDLITAVYDAFGKAKAQGIVRQAVNTRAVGFLGPYRYRIT
jgi:hypothetical protein